MTLTNQRPLLQSWSQLGLTDSPTRIFDSAHPLPFATLTPKRTQTRLWPITKPTYQPTQFDLSSIPRPSQPHSKQAVETALADRVWDKFATERLPEQNCFMTAYEIN